MSTISNDVVNEFKNITDEQLDKMIHDLEEELDHIYGECVENGLNNDPPYTGHCDYVALDFQERLHTLYHERRRRTNESG